MVEYHMPTQVSNNMESRFQKKKHGSGHNNTMKGWVMVNLDLDLK